MVDHRINSLIKRLDTLGYMPYQIQSILEEAANGANLNSISPEQANQIVEYLEEYIVFAEKCKKYKY